MKRTQTLKTVNIKGKEYTDVFERIRFLAENFEYSLTSEAQLINDFWLVKATLIIDGQTYNGHASEKIGDGYINKSSAIENCETSAWGRACAAAGIGINHGITSVEEMTGDNYAPTDDDLNDVAGKVSIQPDIISLTGYFSILPEDWKKDAKIVTLFANKKKELKKDIPSE